MFFMEWQRGVAFIRGINVYASKRITQKRMLEICRGIEDENVRIVRIVKTDNLIFEKRKVHYATVSSRLEKVLSRHFGKPVYVTSRSMRTIQLLTKQKSGKGK
ncbi:hypothetical protein DRO45_00605 [Candidatus Bathyarchaeota archaeon]|nr:MAG: hypothetical protein DRO41_01235 [Candidatus Bathyarchaeota archaeon]RLI22624.1 MAG: hypothetical protein DRO45_00605 [Candidatus Bathyarchaeota archaeon]HDN05752.1 DUF1697 domain-containing protein [Candidatus Bathyarchaeota archaeon]